MTEGVVEFAHVSYAIGHAGDGSARHLLKNICLKLEPGTTTALLGRSGSGKTTLMRMVNGLMLPTTGKVEVSARSVDPANFIQLRRKVGYVIQENGLFPHMTVERNAGMAMELAEWKQVERDKRTKEVLALVGIDAHEFGQRYPWQLSGGQRQRVGFARALALDPSILLMDEPFGALDPLTRAEMQTMLLDLLRRVRKTVLLVTHDLDEALYLAERVVFLAGGEVVADLPSDEVSRSANPQVRDYVAAVHRTVPA